jgi:hypothetical protein
LVSSVPAGKFRDRLQSLPSTSLPTHYSPSCSHSTLCKFKPTVSYWQRH